jgi:hypothetical protein
VKNNIEIIDKDGVVCNLFQNSNNGKTTVYSLIPVLINDDEALQVA